ncbi:MAG TPA: hypothetical protein VMU94_17155 [Streptosporangiaceae bacterium]|nr:hypothetical protein [Streptosporangiaceae bacterium]
MHLLSGTVGRDVTRLGVRLSDGQLLTLRPVAVFGGGYASYAAVAVPFSAAVREIVAHSASGELACAIPFTAGGLIQIPRWLPAARLPGSVGHLLQERGRQYKPVPGRQRPVPGRQRPVPRAARRAGRAGRRRPRDPVHRPDGTAGELPERA